MQYAVDLWSILYNTFRMSTARHDAGENLDNPNMVALVDEAIAKRLRG